MNNHKNEICCYETKIVMEDWDNEDYLMLPGCAYNGNRFRSVKRSYPPMYLTEEFSNELIITDVPRLEVDGSGKIEVTTADLTLPVIALYQRESEIGTLIFLNDALDDKIFGITFERVFDKAVITLSYPERRQKLYRHMKLIEREALFKNAHKNSGEIQYEKHVFKCSSVNELMAEYFYLRDRISGYYTVKNTLSFSRGYQLIEDKYNLLNYRKDTKTYTVGVGDEDEQSRFGYWQAGWVGGGISTLPLIEFGDKTTCSRAFETLDYLFKYQSDYGLFYGVVLKDRIYDDGFGYENTENFNLMRKNGDVLYFLIKQFEILKRLNKIIKKAWENGARRCADALVDVFERYQEWGQFVDVETGKMRVGNTSSAGIIPAALALCYQYFRDEKYINTAVAGGELLYHRDVEKGFTTGGPGEILGCPDSESAFGILESMVVLYEVTGDKNWVEYAETTAHQCSSWCMGYNFHFPQKSEFERLNIDTVGSVFANVQNKHSAPGICTLSGNSLFKLFRITKNKAYLRLINNIAKFIVQCVSSEERPIYAIGREKLPSGYICERVNTSDWETEAMIGGVFAGSCWPEVSHMLTYLEIPGVYIDQETKEVFVFDHVDAVAEDNHVIIKNPYDYYINVRVMKEADCERKITLGAYYSDQMMNITLSPRDKRVLEI